MKNVIVYMSLCGMCTFAFMAGCGDEPGHKEYAQGVKAVEQGKHVRGIALLEKSINKRPGSEDNASAYNYLGIAAWRLGKIEEALDAFETSRRLDPDLFEPPYNMGLIMAESEDYVRAYMLLEEAALVNAHDTRALEYLGQLYMKNEKWSEARRVLFEAYDRAQESPSILTAIGTVEYRMEGAETAISYLMRALDKDANYAPAHFNLGLIYLKDLGDTHKATSYLKRFLQIGKDEALLVRAQRALKTLGTEAVAPRTAPKEEQRASVKKVEDMEAAATPASEPKTIEEKVSGLLALAEARAERNNLQKALELCNKAADVALAQKDYAWAETALKKGVDLSPSDAKAHYALGRLQLEQERYSDALERFRQATELNRKWADAYLSLGLAAVGMEEYDTALVGFKRAVRLESENAEALWQLAVLYDEHIEHEANAASAFRDFVRIHPEDTRVLKAKERLAELEGTVEKEEPPQMRAAVTPTMQVIETVRVADRKLDVRKPVVRNTRAAVQAYNRGTIYQERRDWDRAIYYYTRAVENDEQFVNAFYNLGTVYRAKGEVDLAKDAYMHALEIRPDLINARYNLSLIHAQLEEDTAAINQLRKILETEPSHVSAHQVLGMLYAKDDKTWALAKQHYRQFLKLDPGSPAAASVRQWLSTH